MYVFVLMASKAFGQPGVQGLLAKSAPDPPWGAIGHHRKRPLRSPCPTSKDQQSGKEIPGVSFKSHNFVIVIWGCNLVLGMEGEGKYIVHFICVYACPLLN